MGIEAWASTGCKASVIGMKVDLVFGFAREVYICDR